MIPLSVINGYDLTLDSLSTSALADLRALLSSLEDLSPERSKAILFEAFPEVFNPYAAASSAVSASFYEEVRDLAGVKGSFAAETLDSVDTNRWNALVGAGTAPRMLEQGASNLMFQFLAGGLDSILSTTAADTIYGNAANDPAPARFQRVPKPGCCAFCGLLASRGAAYSSEAAAGRVVGRGVPVEKTKGKRGGQGKGIKSRGSRSAGQTFHDHCKCRTVQVYEGNSIEMQADADKYFESYAEARNKVSDGLSLEARTTKASDGSLKNAYKWVDAGGKQVSATDKTKMIAKAMRLDLDGAAGGKLNAPEVKIATGKLLADPRGRRQDPLGYVNGKPMADDVYDETPSARADADFRFIDAGTDKGADNRATGALQYFMETEKASKLGARNLLNGRGALDGVDLSDADFLLSDGYSADDLNADIVATATKLSQWDANRVPLGKVYKGIQFDQGSTIEDVRKGLLTDGLNFTSVTPDLDLAQKYAGRPWKTRSVVLEIDGAEGIKLNSVGDHAIKTESLFSGDLDILEIAEVDDRFIVKARAK